MNTKIRFILFVVWTVAMLAYFSHIARADVTGLPFTDAQYSHFLGGAYAGRVLSEYMDPLEVFATVGMLSFCKELYDFHCGFDFSEEDIGVGWMGVCFMYSVEFILD